MKNRLTIDLDTERDNAIVIYKPEGFIEPTEFEDKKKLVMDDISTTFEALCLMIKVADKSNFATKKDLVDSSIKYLQGLLN